MKNYIYLSTCILILSISCADANKTLTDPNEIINRAIDYAGGDSFKNSNIRFDFRDKHYKASRNNGTYQLERHFKDSLGTIKDVLNNTGFNRYQNDSLLNLDDDWKQRYSNSVNSVHYFSVLPFGLNDDAVIKTYMGKSSIKGTDYYKIKVHFKQIGGGEDFQDVFIYWVSTNNFAVDYLAYSYQDSKVKVGLRFREAYNQRFIKGLRFVDYNNYKPASDITALESLDQLFIQGKLTLLSKIENTNVTVDL
ncbi:MAG: deoxyribose-phosphate aldolase [Flavobacteriaceae bacterium]|nr:MAG: deoxyribose-phosphate aldolase [Flavobacteriaceae bacterium]